MVFMLKEGVTIDSIIISTVQQVLATELKQLREDIHILLDGNNGYPEYMSLKEACNYLNVSTNTLKRYVDEYGLAVIKIDGVKRISKSELDSFMLSHTN